LDARFIWVGVVSSFGWLGVEVVKVVFFVPSWPFAGLSFSERNLRDDVPPDDFGWGDFALFADSTNQCFNEAN
jgi:hypothetical protein